MKLHSYNFISDSYQMSFLIIFFLYILFDKNASRAIPGRPGRTPIQECGCTLPRRKRQGLRPQLCPGPPSFIPLHSLMALGPVGHSWVWAQMPLTLQLHREAANLFLPKQSLLESESQQKIAHRKCNLRSCFLTPKQAEAQEGAADSSPVSFFF